MRPLVPRDLDLDLWNGVLYVGVVPFAMEEVRPSWLPEVAAMDFLETNVRTYVHHHGAPGVYFLSLEAASALACVAARLTFGLPYYWASMKLAERDGIVTYETDRRVGGRARGRFRYRVGDALEPSREGTLQHFLLERYYLFVERGGEILRGQVHHTPYPARAAEMLECDETLTSRAGLPALSRPPDQVHYSEGVDVEVFNPVRCASRR